MINEKAIKGEKDTGFEEAGDLGRFACGNCSYFNGTDACNQKDMMAKSKRPRHPDGTVELGPNDCCEYVDRTGKEKLDRSYLNRLVQIARSLL